MLSEVDHQGATQAQAQAQDRASKETMIDTWLMLRSVASISLAVFSGHEPSPNKDIKHKHMV